MHQQLIPLADEIDRANRTFMDESFDAQSRASAGSEHLAVITGAALLGALAWAQIFLLRRMRRIINPPLLIATVLTVVFTLLLVRRFGSAREDLREAKDDAFASIDALWRARAIAYDAKGDEIRFLLDRESRAIHQDAFRSHVGILTSRPELSAKAESEIAKGKGKLSGLFAVALENVTFAGERDAALEMIRAFSAYYVIDGKMRTLESAGKHDKAVDLCIGTDANQSSAAFLRFDEALGKVLAINKTAFDRVIEEGDAGLRSAEWLDPVFAIAIAALAVAGLRRRMKEYAA